MPLADSIPLFNFVVALGLGLLIGAERERRNRERNVRSSAGIRTFSIAALAGATSLAVGGVTLLAVTTAAVAVFVALSYWRTWEAEDPGLTSEIALVLVVLLGALAVRQPGLAATLGVASAILLAARTPLHRFVGSVLTEQEVTAALAIGGATVIVLPLLPDRAMGPYGALNPRSIWIVVILVLTIGSAGHVAVRAFGARFGLPLAGLASGFISSAATISAMGGRARQTPPVLSASVAGAVLSTVATILQMAVVLAATSTAALSAMTPALMGAGLAAAAYGAVFTLKAVRQTAEGGDDSGEAFSLTTAAAFAGVLSTVLVASAALSKQFGEAGAIAAAGLAGLVDTHAAAVSIASLVTSGHMGAHAAVIPILVGLTTNTATKIGFAVASGGRPFAVRVVPGLILVAAAAWLGAWMTPAA